MFVLMPLTLLLLPGLPRWCCIQRSILCCASAAPPLHSPAALPPAAASGVQLLVIQTPVAGGVQNRSVTITDWRWVLLLRLLS